MRFLVPKLGPSVTELDPLEFVLPLAAFASGSVDIISFAQLGGIFASAMTGNLAFLAFYSAAGSLYSAIGALLALFGFSLGASAGTMLSSGRGNHKAISVLLVTETVLLSAAALLWFFASHRNGCLSADVLILILSGAMGLQSICGKKINLSNIPTVVFTSTLTNIVIAVTDFFACGKPGLPTETKRQIISLCVYFIGAFTAGLFTFFNLSFIIFLPLASAILALGVNTSKNVKI